MRIFKEFDCKVIAFIGCLVLVESYQEHFKQLTQLSASVGLKSYAFCEISLFPVSAIVHFAWFLALCHAVNSAIS